MDTEWNTTPKRDEVRITSPEVHPHRSRKNTRRWCRGVPGREHVIGVTPGKNGLYMLARYGADNPHALCRWHEKHAWTWVDGVRRWVGKGDWYWSCQHVYTCGECGKVMGDVPGRECPDWKPRTP